MKAWIGIDPGATGACAIIWEDGKVEVHDYDEGYCPFSWEDEVLFSAAIEKAMVMPKQGISSSGKFMTNYGRWLGRLQMAGIKVDIVTPQKWKKVMFDSAPKQDPKEMARLRAIRLFPGLSMLLKRKKDHGRAEALLIAEYCRRMNS